MIKLRQTLEDTGESRPFVKMASVCCVNATLNLLAGGLFSLEKAFDGTGHGLGLLERPGL
jgi:hypothetical protein